MQKFLFANATQSLIAEKKGKNIQLVIWEEATNTRNIVGSFHPLDEKKELATAIKKVVTKMSK